MIVCNKNQNNKYGNSAHGLCILMGNKKFAPDLDAVGAGNAAHELRTCCLFRC